LFRDRIESIDAYIRIPGILLFSKDYFNEKFPIFERIQINFFRKVNSIESIHLEIYNNDITIDKSQNKLFIKFPIRLVISFTDTDGINRFTTREVCIKRTIKFIFENANEKYELYAANISFKINKGEVGNFSLDDSTKTSIVSIDIKFYGQLIMS